MSSFSNTDTGAKTADPYTAQNKQEPSLKEKVEDLFTFIDKTKICLMTAQTAGSDLLTSRAMALAAKVRCLHGDTAPHVDMLRRAYWCLHRVLVFPIFANN